ncbi:MAG TPA: sulfotransferase [Oscillatoriales cyanobacterium M59_W2019_021]|nr:MAG: sulfotransferase [Cyanobacteria bacterium J055]HIK32235.1 sulfotransferase [Oscillatoriales cyanobacterium M4454_W2019_049]HIK52294.1 sulfotransferase [Oscillatoriales cyanobacterium M59_W2019_021]
MKLPNFIIIGAGKGGTTSLYKYLQQHPQIFVPEKKELYFFAFEGEEHPDGVTRFEDYQALFQNTPEDKVIGEVSSVYLFRPKAPERIKKYVPNAKLIAILRNPTDRAFSSYLMHVGDRHPSIFDPQTGKLIEFAEIVRDRGYFIQIGFYYEQLKRYYDRFDPSQIKIYLYEDLVSDNEKLVRDMFRFVGVDETFTPDTSQRHKVSGIPKNRMLHDLVMTQNPIRSFAASILRPILSDQTRDRIRNRINKKNAERPTLSPELRQEAIAIYRDDILKLQDLLDRDLSAWLKN